MTDPVRPEADRTDVASDPRVGRRPRVVVVALAAVLGLVAAVVVVTLRPDPPEVLLTTTVRLRASPGAGCSDDPARWTIDAMTPQGQPYAPPNEGPWPMTVVVSGEDGPRWDDRTGRLEVLGAVDREPGADRPPGGRFTADDGETLDLVRGYETLC